MNLKSALAVGAAFGILGVGSAFATFARVESMGKNTTYIMDDVSIFDNPANINLYPNYLIGEFGLYNENVAVGENRDPQHPNFGGIFSLGLGSGEYPDPRLTIGGLFGRMDSELGRFLPTTVILENGTESEVPETVTNFDGFLGGTLANGNALGLHIFIAHQDGGRLLDDGSYQPDYSAYASVVRADGGVNWQIGNSMDLELAFGLARVQYGSDHKSFFDDGDFSYLGKARAFFSLDALDGELVPAVSAHYIQAPGIEDIHSQVGVGINVALDRGFFWLGVDFIWNKTEAGNWSFDHETGKTSYDASAEREFRDEREEMGGQISFGIERNIWWDWFVIRVGGKKSILYTECDKHWANAGKQDGLCATDGNYFSTNPLANGTADDHVGFGFGINIEEKLKIDVLVAEDLLFRNPFQGEGRLFSRISATYAF